jgi:hypothetical protein
VNKLNNLHFDNDQDIHMNVKSYETHGHGHDLDLLIIYVPHYLQHVAYCISYQNMGTRTDTIKDICSKEIKPPAQNMLTILDSTVNNNRKNLYHELMSIKIFTLIMTKMITRTSKIMRQNGHGHDLDLLIIYPTICCILYTTYLIGKWVHRERESSHLRRIYLLYLP